jgi:hypothetical protein
MKNEKNYLFTFSMSFLGILGNFFKFIFWGDSVNLPNHEKRVMNVCVLDLPT